MAEKKSKFMRMLALLAAGAVVAGAMYGGKVAAAFQHQHVQQQDKAGDRKIAYWYDTERRVMAKVVDSPPHAVRCQAEDVHYLRGEEDPFSRVPLPVRGPLSLGKFLDSLEFACQMQSRTKLGIYAHAVVSYLIRNQVCRQ